MTLTVSKECGPVNGPCPAVTIELVGDEGVRVEGVGDERLDGRRARSERSREAVVEAILDLFGDGVERPTVEQVAERAGVSRRSVFRHFEDLQALNAAAVQRHLHRLAPALAPPASGGGRSERVARLAAHRARLYEEMTPVRQVSERLRGRSELITTTLEQGRTYLRGQLEVLFAGELGRLSPPARDELLDGLEVATSWSTWHVLRSQQRCSADRAERVLAQLAEGVLARAAAQTRSGAGGRVSAT
jgi:AcrR family transcriptional regulator